MQKWEYRSEGAFRNWGWSNEVAKWKLGEWELDFSFQEMGDEGWELVTAIPVASIPYDFTAGVTSEITYYFKRPIQ